MSFKGRALVRFSVLKDPGMHLSKGSPGSTRKVLSHLRYIGFRSRELDLDKDTKGLFDAKTNNASLKKFYNSVKNEPGLKFSNTVKLHKIIISLKQEDYELYGKDFREIARNIMEKLEERKNMKLEWVGSVHLKEGHPHVHLAVKSIGKDEGNNNRRLYIDVEDIQYVRQEIDRFTGRDQYYSREQSLDKEQLDFSLFKEFSKAVDKLIRDGERATEKAKNRADRQAQIEAQREKDDRER